MVRTWGRGNVGTGGAVGYRAPPTLSRYHLVTLSRLPCVHSCRTACGRRPARAAGHRGHCATARAGRAGALAGCDYSDRADTAGSLGTRPRAHVSRSGCNCGPARGATALSGLLSNRHSAVCGVCWSTSLSNEPCCARWNRRLINWPEIATPSPSGSRPAERRCRLRWSCGRGKPVEWCGRTGVTGRLAVCDDIELAELDWDAASAGVSR